MFSGIKLGVDIERLYHSIRPVSATQDGEPQTRLAVHKSGHTPFTQIMINKMFLFTQIYHHHKVRAADCMLWAIFYLAQQRGVAIGGRRLESPIDYLYLTDEKLLMPELVEGGDTDIISLINDVRSRNLWKRAIVIARNTVPPSMHSRASGTNASSLYAGVMDLVGNEREKVLFRRQVAFEIWERAGKPCQEHEVWLDVPRLPTMSEAKKMWMYEPLQPPKTLDEFFPVDGWVELYGAHLHQAHVFAPAAVCSVIGEATEGVFLDRFGLTFLPAARQFAKSQ
jgi:hypothetical protein